MGPLSAQAFDVSPAKDAAIMQAVRALACAAAAGGAALISPPLALLLAALLAARALMAARTAPHLSMVGAAGPILAALAVGAWTGLAGGIGVLFLWRVFADARWSATEAARLAVAAGRPGETRLSARIPIWLTAAYAALLVAYSAPHMVVGLPLDLPQVPFWAPLGAGVLAALGIGDWLLRRAADWRLGEFAPAPAAHLLSYHLLFLAAYGASFDLSAGVIALIAWRLAHAAPGRIFARA